MIIEGQLASDLRHYENVLCDLLLGTSSTIISIFDILVVLLHTNTTVIQASNINHIT